MFIHSQAPVMRTFSIHTSTDVTDVCVCLDALIIWLKHSYTFAVVKQQEFCVLRSIVLTYFVVIVI